MKVNLIASQELQPELLNTVVGLLQAIPGPIQFVCHSNQGIEFNEEEQYLKETKTEDEFEKMQMCMEEMPYFKVNKIRIFPIERETADWNSLFDKCRKHRRLHNLPDNEFVFLLTDVANTHNWFASLDPNMPFNGFIHCDDWDHYLEAPAHFPIAYEVIALIMQKYIFEGDTDLRSIVHENAIGCVSDMCMQKKEIILKLRTADICSNCMERIGGKIPMPVIHHALAIMESLRIKMLFAQNLRQFSPLSRLIIDKNKIFLPDFGNVEIRIRPLEKALYFLYLKYPDGIYMSSLSDHRQELYDIYSAISTTGDLQEMKTRIDDMVNATSNSASEKIARIKRVFEENIGSELARHYYIHGEPREVKRIILDRSKVTFNNV